MRDQREESFFAKDWQMLYARGLTMASWDDAPNKIKVKPYLAGEYEFERRGMSSMPIPPVKLIGRDGAVELELPQQGFEEAIRAIEARRLALGPGIEGGGSHGVECADKA